MRIVTLEEHVTFPEMLARMSQDELAKYPIGQSPAIQKLAPKLADVNGGRLQSMDANGINVQVLSVAGAGADLLDPKTGPAFASAYNDLIAEKIAGNTTRFKAFAHLPMTAPEAAAQELARTVVKADVSHFIPNPRAIEIWSREYFRDLVKQLIIAV